MKNKLISLGLCMFLVLTLFTGCGSSEIKYSEDVVIQNLYMGNAEYPSLYIYFANNSDKTVIDMDIAIIFYDQNGLSLGATETTPFENANMVAGSTREAGVPYYGDATPSYYRAVVQKIKYQDGTTWTMDDFSRWSTEMQKGIDAEAEKASIQKAIDEKAPGALKNEYVSLVGVKQFTGNMFAENEAVKFKLQNNSDKDISSVYVVFGCYDKHKLPISTSPYEYQMKNFKEIKYDKTIKAGSVSSTYTDDFFFPEGTKYYTAVVTYISFKDSSAWINESYPYWMMQNMNELAI